MRPFTTAIAGAVLAAAAVAAMAQPATPQDPLAAVEKRQEHMRAMGGAMQTIGRFLKGEGGTVEDVHEAAAALRERAHADLLALFPTGTAVGVGDTRAKPEIWQRWAELQQRAAPLAPAADRLVEAAQSGDRAQLADAFAATGAVCGGCHSTFRAERQ